jgi:hypothetical protein
MRHHKHHPAEGLEPDLQRRAGDAGSRQGRCGRLLTALALAAALAACGGSDGPAGSTGPTGPTGPVGPAGLDTVASMQPEPAGARCPSGGTRIHSGLDSDRNGVLDAHEITGTQFVCNGASGEDGASTLVRVQAEPAGSACASGGIRIVSGVDRNADGVLQEAEVTASAPACHGAAGPAGATGATGARALLTVRPEPAGPGCPVGGQRLEAGSDANQNGVLDTDEVTSTALVCHGVNGTVGGDGRDSLVAQAVEPAGAHCAHGGSRIMAGLDANNDGVLQPSEVSTTSYACHGAPGATGAVGPRALVAVSAEVAGVHCPVGGQRIETGIDANANGVLESGEVASTAYACNGANGTNGADGLGSLIAQAAEPAGANCTYGGSKVTSGVDADRDGVLDPGEVTATSYVCSPSGQAGMHWVHLTAGSVQAVPNTGYLVDNASAATVTLPANASLAIGDRVAVTGMGSGGWTLAQNAGQRIHGANLGLVAGAIWTARESSRNWMGVASSSDGMRLVAAGFASNLFTSIDGGVTWTARAAVRDWGAVASSADGTRLLAAAWSGQLYTSSDSGASWTPRNATRLWQAVASSADGTRLVAVVLGGQIYTSTDGGVNWTARESNRFWSSVASSADGTRLVATVLGGQIYTSTDGGANWTARAAVADWQNVASSADGTRLAATVFGGQIYTSADGGANWTPRATDLSWNGLASSSDGMRLVALEHGGQAYVSTDAGVSWTAYGAARDWTAVASSADGSRLVATEQFGQIYTSDRFSTLGAAGSLSGGQFDAIELQYLGAGVFVPIRAVGGFTLN